MRLVADNIVKRIKNHTVIDNISLDVTGGNVYGFIGRNGSGKTMLFRALSGLIRLDSGEIRLDDKVLGRDFSILPNLGIVLENVGLYPELTGFGNLKYLAGFRSIVGDNEIKSSLEKVGLDPHDTRPYRKYSLGMKQRLAIAQAIMEKPSVIMLDEPTNGLDNEGVALVSHLLAEERDRGTIILIASHNKDDVFILCDYVYRMESGRLIKG